MVPVIVACDGVKLKLTCTAALLSQPFTDCVVTPFLGAFNKKRGTAFSAGILAKVEVDGVAVGDLSLSGAVIIGTSEAPTVDIFLPSGTAGTSGPCAEAVAAVLKLDPSSTPTDACVAALKSLRVALKDAPTAAEPALTPRVVGIVAEISCLKSADTEWTSASAEAAVCLNNMLAASRDKAGALLCAEELGALPTLIACFEKAANLPLPRLRLLSPLVFHLSLLPAINAHANRLAKACRTCLSYVASSLSVPGLVDEAVGAALAADIIRATFNLLRVSPPNASGEAGAVAIADLVDAVANLLDAGAGAPSSADGALGEMKRAALQLPVVLGDASYATLAPRWRAVCDMLLPLLVHAEATGTEDDGHQAVLPMLTLQKICEADKAVCAQVKAHIFGEVDSAPRNADPYQPLGVHGWDPNAVLGPSASLRMHLLKLLTSVTHAMKHVGGNLLYAVCSDDPHEFTHLCGLGSAAGLLQERGLFAGFQQAIDAQAVDAS